jgi:hypothetical protein
MSTATISGRSGADSTSAKCGTIRTAPRRLGRTKAAIHPPAQPSTPASHDFGRCVICATLAQLLRRRYAVCAGGDP